MELLSQEQISTYLEDLPWQLDQNQIIREFKFKDFEEALAFVNRVGQAAQEENHHPDITIYGWNKVRLALTNHAAGGLTAVDVTMAQRFDELANS